MGSWHFSDVDMNIMQRHPSKYAMEFAKTKPYPYMNQYKRALEKHLKEKENNKNKED